MKLVLYTTHCPKCNVLEKKLQQGGFEYEINDNLNRMKELKFKSAPILEVDGKFLEFKQACDWTKEWHK